MLLLFILFWFHRKVKLFYSTKVCVNSRRMRKFSAIEFANRQNNYIKTTFIIFANFGLITVPKMDDKNR